MENYAYIGSGKVYLRERGALKGLLEVGNCSALTFGVTEESKQLKDFTQPGGGTYAEVKKISAVECNMTLHDLSPENLARVLYAGTSAVAAGPIADEAVTVYPNALAPLKYLPDMTVVLTVATAQAAAAAWAATTTYAAGAYAAPTVANGFYYKATVAGASDATEPAAWPTVVGDTVVDGTVTWTCAGKTALVLDTDYERRPGGLFMFEGTTIGGEQITVGYTRVASDIVQAIVNSGKEYEMVFDGLNEARSGKRTRITAHRLKAGAAQNLGFIGEEFAGMEVTGTLLNDASQIGDAISKYFKVDIEQ